MDDSAATNDELNLQGPEAPSVPTDEQVKLGRRYGRSWGTFLGLSLFAFTFAIFNVVRGLTAINAATALLLSVFGVVFAFLAAWSFIRRRRLNDFIASGSVEVPKHLRTWQNTVILIVTLPLLFLVTSGLTVNIVGPAAMQDAIGTDEKEVQVAEFRAQVLAQLNAAGPGVMNSLCSDLENPSAVEVLRQTARESITSSAGLLSASEMRAILVDTYLTYCGISN